MKEIRNNIDRMIMEAMKAKEKGTAEVYKLIKAAFLNWKTAKNAKPLDAVAEIIILQRMIKQRQDSIEQYKAAGRQDLVNQELMEIEVLQTLLPKIPTEQDIIYYVEEHYPNKIEKLQMGKVIKEVKTNLPGADGKVISEIVKLKLV